MQHEAGTDRGSNGDWEIWVVKSCIPKGKILTGQIHVLNGVKLSRGWNQKIRHFKDQIKIYLLHIFSTTFIVL